MCAEERSGLATASWGGQWQSNPSQGAPGKAAERQRADSPPDRHDDEVGFWRVATGGRWVPGDVPEFAGKLHPADGPVQLLLQRLGPETSGPTRAHIDIGSDDIDAEVTRVVGLGAERLWPGDGWYALCDPTGLVFCVTGNPSESAVH